jgi:hypothetical protein
MVLASREGRGERIVHRHSLRCDCHVSLRIFGGTGHVLPALRRHEEMIYYAKTSVIRQIPHWAASPIEMRPVSRVADRRTSYKQVIVPSAASDSIIRSNTQMSSRPTWRRSF